jgi:hypothetical protein
MIVDWPTLQRCIDTGARNGWLHAHQYLPNPSADTIHSYILEEVENAVAAMVDLDTMHLKEHQ